MHTFHLTVDFVWKLYLIFLIFHIPYFYQNIFDKGTFFFVHVYLSTSRFWTLLRKSPFLTYQCTQQCLTISKRSVEGRKEYMHSSDRVVPLVPSNISHSYEDNESLFSRNIPFLPKVQKNNRVFFCVGNLEAFILITFLEDIRSRIRRDIKELELKVSLRMERHGSLIFYPISKRRKAGKCRRWEAPEGTTPSWPTVRRWREFQGARKSWVRLFLNLSYKVWNNKLQVHFNVWILG